jgi:hypothetical protein
MYRIFLPNLAQVSMTSYWIIEDFSAFENAFSIDLRGVSDKLDAGRRQLPDIGRNGIPD